MEKNKKKLWKQINELSDKISKIIDCKPLKFNARTISATYPKKIIYIDIDIDWNDPSQTVKAAIDSGFNVIIFAFYLVSGPTDMAVAWQSLTQIVQKDTVDYAHKNNAVLLVSAGGATEAPYELSPDVFATSVCKFVTDNNLDGVDFDLENISPGFVNTYPSGTVNITEWISSLSMNSRRILGDSKLITHAPQSPYFGKIGDPLMWPGITGGYSSIYNNDKNIDWFNIQYYNQGASAYDTYKTLFLESGGDFPGTSVSEITNYGIPLDKIVVGKPLLKSDIDPRNSGYVDPLQLNNYFNTAKDDLKWNTGIMYWQWHANGEPARIIHIVYP